MDLNSFFQSKEETNNEKKWNIIEANVLDNHNIYDYQSYIKDVFYISCYQCPHCCEPLYKTIFQPGNEYQIQTQIKTIQLKRVFTCNNCLSFLSAIPGNRLNEGILFEVKYNLKEYNKKLDHMNENGSTEGRSD